MEIKPVSYIWQRLLKENGVPLDGIVVEVAPGYEKKIGDALALEGFTGTVVLIEPDQAAATHSGEMYRRIMPKATVKTVIKPLQEVRIGVDIPVKVDALVANHPFDDMALAFALHGKEAAFFTEERESGEELTASTKELYESISDKDYIHGILATIVVWKDFVGKLKPVVFIASQYPSRKLALKKLTKRQNTGLIIIEMLRDYYESYLKEQYEDKSFGRQGDPAWWLVARKPYADLASDLAERPVAMQRLGEEIFVPQRARHLDAADYDVVYADPKYFKESGYGTDAPQLARSFAIVLDNENRFSGPELTVYADRQKDSTEISLSGNLGSGRAVYYGKKHNIMGVGKTTLCTSTIPSHSTGTLELIGALRRVILSRWLGHFTKNTFRHPVVLALKKTVEVKWSFDPIPLSLLVREDKGALDRPSHVEYAPEIPVDFEKTLAAYAKLDAQYFAYRFILGAWSAGNYSLNGHVIDLETASFVKYRGPYNTASQKYYHNFFGYEGAGFVKMLQQLAQIKGIKDPDIEKRFYEKRKRDLALCFLSLLGIDEVRAAAFFEKNAEQVRTLSGQFEKLAKKISPKRAPLNLYESVPDEDDPSLLDMSNLFRSLAGLFKSSQREKLALDRLLRTSALAQVKPGIEYMPQPTAKGEVNRGEEFLRDNAAVTHAKLENFLSETKDFVRALFKLLDLLESEHSLPKRAYWNEQLRIMNQDFPVLNELNAKLKYWVGEYRTGRINTETLNAEIEKLCQLPDYPTGKDFDLKDIPLIEYLKPKKRELKTLSRYLRPVMFNAGVAVVREGEDADSLFILVQGICRVVVKGLEISTVSDRGALIGEAVVFEGRRKRAASVFAQTPVRLLQVSRDHLKEMTTTYPRLSKLLASLLSQRRQGVADQVRGLEIFEGVDPEFIRLFLADKASEKRFQSGKRIIAQEEKAPGVYVLIRGAVLLSWSEKVVGTGPLELTDVPLTRGLFGERSVILGEGAVCTVTANDDVTMLFIREDDFLDLLDRHPQLLRNCLDHISDYSRANVERGSLVSMLEEKLRRAG